MGCLAHKFFKSGDKVGIVAKAGVKAAFGYRRPRKQKPLAFGNALCRKIGMGRYAQMTAKQPGHVVLANVKAVCHLAQALNFGKMTVNVSEHFFHLSRQRRFVRGENPLAVMLVYGGHNAEQGRHTPQAPFRLHSKDG